MSGTPLDLTPFGSVLNAIGWLYWLIACAILGVAWWLPKVLWQKIVAVAIAVAAVYLVFVRPVQARLLAQQQRHQESNAKLDEAMTLFKKRCESAGEKIARTVENVDGVVWMKWREPISNADNFADQFKLNDPYGQDCGAADCLLRLLRVPKGMEEFSAEAARHIFGYRYVESFDPTDQLRYRYVGTLRPHPNWTHDKISQRKQETGRDLSRDSYTFQLTKAPVEKFDARYGITWDDLSTREDRQHWIAGSSLKVVDLQTNEVIAERIGYMIDQGQGSQAGFRSPWLYAEYTACPAFDVSESRSPIKASRSRKFVQRVLKSTQGE